MENRIRQHLEYLNFFERFHCTYCAYANGLVAHMSEILARTGHYFCPIKHARKVPGSRATGPLSGLWRGGMPGSNNSAARLNTKSKSDFALPVMCYRPVSLRARRCHVAAVLLLQSAMHGVTVHGSASRAVFTSDG